MSRYLPPVLIAVFDMDKFEAEPLKITDVHLEVLWSYERTGNLPPKFYSFFALFKTSLRTFSTCFEVIQPLLSMISPRSLCGLLARSSSICSSNACLTCSEVTYPFFTEIWPNLGLYLFEISLKISSHINQLPPGIKKQVTIHYR